MVEKCRTECNKTQTLRKDHWHFKSDGRSEGDKTMCQSCWKKKEKIAQKEREQIVYRRCCAVCEEEIELKAIEWRRLPGVPATKDRPRICHLYYDKLYGAAHKAKKRAGLRAWREKNKNAKLAGKKKA